MQADAEGLWTGAARLVREIRRQRRPRLHVVVRAQAPLGGAPGSLPARTADMLAEGFDHRMAALGVPGRAQVEVVVDETVDGCRVEVTGAPCRVPPHRLTAALDAGAAAASPGDCDPLSWGAWLRTACDVAVEWDPGILLAPAQRQALLAAVRDAGSHAYTDAVLADALSTTVAHGVSCGDLVRLAEVLQSSDRDVMAFDAASLAEVLICRRNRAGLGMRVDEATARTVSTDGFDSEAFPRMRARVFADLGLHLPDVDVVVDDHVPQGCCAVRLHDVSCRPERLPAAPSTEALAAVLEARVREHAWWFVDLDHVRATVDTLRVALPALVETVTSRYTIVELSVFARSLLAESVPLRNAARLMVLLLDVPPVGTGADVVRLAEPRRGDRGTSGRPSPAEVVAYARQQVLEEQTRAAPGPRDVVAHVVPDGEDIAGLLRHAEAAASSGASLVVATQARRAAVRAVLAGQYPDVPVRASEEFPVSFVLREPPVASSLR